jgi:hypothetical protein
MSEESRMPYLIADGFLCTTEESVLEPLGKVDEETLKTGHTRRFVNLLKFPWQCTYVSRACWLQIISGGRNVEAVRPGLLQAGVG